jgi:hypothetical protein
MRRALVSLVVASAPVVLLAQVSRGDFVRGVEIRTEGGGSLYRVLLPDDVYDTSTRADLADMRVLNAAGETVPHTFRGVRSEADLRPEWQTVPSFPMSEAQTGAAARTHVRVGLDGAVLEVTNDRKAGRATTAYLVDTSAMKERVARMALTWEAAPGETFLVPVAVTVSDDLSQWRTVVSSAAIAQLQRESYTLTQSEIELPIGERAKYFRISWPKELAAVKLKAVRVRPQAAAALPEIRWRTLAADRVEPAGVASYDTHAFLPVEYVDVDFAEPTDIATVTMRTRPKPDADATVRHSGLFYGLQGPGGSIRSSYARIPPTFDRYWTIETRREGGWKQNRAPKLKVGWHPHELLFVARGAGPFTLAYGSARVGPTDAPLDQLLATLSRRGDESQIRLATVGEPRTLGGADALTPAPRTIPRKQIVLWTVLIIAVGALAFLAARLFRDTKKQAA